MKTAVEWLVTKLPLGVKGAILDKIEQAKEMEKEQIIYARATAPILPSIDKADYFIEALEYYNETFKSE
jgi:hypothetical protein